MINKESSVLQDLCENCRSSKNIKTCRIFHGWCLSHSLPYGGYKLSNKATIEVVSKIPDNSDFPSAVDVSLRFCGNKKNMSG